MNAIETLLVFALLPALLGWVIARWQVRRKMDRLRRECEQATRATLARMKFRHDAGVRGWQTREKKRRERVASSLEFRDFALGQILGWDERK
jgi:hypothetical protein